METKYTLNSKTLEIVQDTDPQNPRTSFDNLGTLLFSHRRYNNFGDEKKAKDLVGSTDSNDYRRFINRKDVISLPVWMYDHSGTTIKVSRSGKNPFHCPWDSGLLGWIVVTKKQVSKEYGWKVLTKERIEEIKTYLEGEIEILDQFMTGEVYGFRILDENGEEIDSCWGFYGSDPLTNGIADHIADEWKSVIEKSK